MPLVHPAIAWGGNENHGQPLQLDGSGNLLVNIAQGSITSTSGAQYNATPPTFTNGTTNPLQMDQNGKLLISGTINATSAATYNSTPPSFSNGTSNALQADSHGSLKVSPSDASGAAMGVLANPLRVDPTGTTTQPVSGTVTANAGTGMFNTKAIAPTLNTGQVSVGTTATQILASNSNRTRLTITNLGTTDVYVGPANTVTTSNGALLVGVKGAPVLLRYTGAVYAIVASGTQTVTYAEETN